jgi:hypothetical protein
VNAAEVLATVKADGVELAIRDGRLCARPAGRIRPPLAELVRQHSQGLRALLAESAEESERERFDERAAIHECEAGYSRQEAERLASGHKLAKASWPFDEWGDLRPCLLCRNLTQIGVCLSARRGELRGARDYAPTFPGQPRRCIGYDPKVDDPDRSSGRERWPELVESQAPRESATRGKPMEARSRSKEVA